MNTYPLTKEELQQLTSQFRLSLTFSPTKDFSIKSVDLLNEKICKNYLIQLSNLFLTDSLAVVASQFAKRYAYLVTIPSLYAMFRFNKIIDLSIQNTSLESYFLKQNWLPHLYLTHQSTVALSTNEIERCAQVQEQLRILFQNNLVPVWETISHVSSVSKKILWENTAIYIYWLYETKVLELEEKNHVRRAKLDFETLLNGLNGQPFHEKKNPFAYFYSEKQPLPNKTQPIRMRKTCCLLYKTGEKKTFCHACPSKQRFS